MTGVVAGIWRHPIKSHGREELLRVSVTQGHCLPLDRKWAVAHDAAKLDDGKSWVPCTNFSRGAKAPSLMAISAVSDEQTNTVTLTHPSQPGIIINPDRPEDHERFLDWVMPLSPENRARPAQLVTVGRGMTDTEFESISFINLASHRAVEEKLGREISPLRWRGNVLLDGFAPWEERNWIGKRLRVGEAEFEVREHITRCLATTASTRTGERDADTLGVLNTHWGHRDCGIYAVVTKPGVIVREEPVEVIG
ncbi:hypothetical protein SAMN04488030_2179 [Aliiroseovarius halocynthiae]|uniref:MOSC domain-containing protein n=1 Tax=Aliiroseovarius halocynthiae TaxID=985055 RepID=A0A545SXT6_9RHOB|nr:MOSC domain-containing protein [Aliiroseovarius halocynthiae]TQV69782.1 MOSC domain-containing protein [Aliiroseovarius halocynthiae]SMR81758.1 hypothetical protein SAMN04488030_2179 [Aliiroseovarius halocynthiae]